MATTTPFGYKIPDVGDLALSWMQNLSDNWARISAHTHNGIDSDSLTITSITKLTTDILSAVWVNDGNGNFTQTVTVPGAITEINDFHVYFFVVATGERIFPDVIRQSATTYEVGINDNSLALTATYV